ncbi:MAG: glycosyltransferase family 4 protein [Chakrabartia sp.]
MTGQKTDRADAAERPYVLDVSRLIWRGWTGRLPTGIDRVCHAYLEHFAPDALAMVQRGRYRTILSHQSSDALFALLRQPGPGFRRAVMRLLARALAQRTASDHGQGKIYLNIGHTGLDAPGLADWLADRRLKAVHFIHDLIPLTHPYYCRPGEAARHRRRMQGVLATASGIIANSADTLDALQQFANHHKRDLPRAQIVAWLGTDPLAAAAAAPPLTPDTPFFVMTGTIEARKNHLMMLRIWQILVHSCGAAAPHLVLVGQRGWEASDVFALLDSDTRLGTRVTELGHCRDATLARLLGQARALLMPSFAEGYGLPVIEALQRGCPVIASDIAVFREIGQNIPRLISPADATAWMSAILDYAGPSADRDRQIKALQSYAAPSWADHFRRVEPWLRRIADQPS